MSTATLASPPCALAAAWRIRFVETAPPGARVLARFFAPRRCLAVAERSTPEGLLQGEGPGQRLAVDRKSARVSDSPRNEERPFAATLDLLLLPAGQPMATHWLERAQDWLGHDTGEPLVDVVIRSERLRWRPGRAVLWGSAQLDDETVAGLVEFAYYEGQLRRLEREVEADWPAAEADVGLTHRVASPAERRWSPVAAMTERAGRWRIQFARLERRLEKPSSHLPGPARRVVAELQMQAETADRLRAVDDAIEVYEDLYERVNDRLSEFSYFRREYRLEQWVVVLLVVEVVLMLIELGLHWCG